MSDSTPSTIGAEPIELRSRTGVPDVAMLLLLLRGPLCLGLLVGLNLALAYVLVVAASRTAGGAMVSAWPMRAIALAIGVVLGQTFLVVLWLGLAGPRAVGRYPLAGMVFLVGASTISLGIGSAQSGDGALLAAFAAVPVIAAHLPLLSVRWLLGWRLAFDAATYPVERAGKTQFYLAHCFWMTALVAMPLALYRSLAGMFREGEAIPAWTLAGIALLVMLAGMSSTWVVFAKDRRWIPIVVLSGVVCAARAGEHLLDRWLVTGVVTDYMLLAAPMTGIALAVLINLGLLRAAGLQLLILRLAKERPAA